MHIDAGLLRDGLRFDEGYFLYVEDMDFCRRVIARGRTLRVTRRAVIRHREGGSQATEAPALGGLRPTQLRYVTRNKVRFARIWLSPLQRTVFYAVAFVAKPLAAMLTPRQVPRLGSYFAALREGLRMPLPDDA